MDKSTEDNVAVATYLHQSRIMRQRLLDLDVALHQLRAGSYRQCLDALKLLGDLCNFFAYESQQGFQEEEARLYPLVQSKQPQLRGLLRELRQEHKALRAGVEAFGRELVRFNVTGHLHELPHAGRTLLHLFRRHLEREARELIPLALLDLDSAPPSSGTYGKWAAENLSPAALRSPAESASRLRSSNN